MPLKKLPYIALEPLIVENLSTIEDHLTLELIKRLRQTRRRGWLTKDELVDICYWKSPRAIRHIKSNRTGTIKRLTQIAFRSRSEQTKIVEFTKLKGVSVPMASAILMLTNPKRYGVIDIRVWEVLHSIGTMQTNSRGVNFNFKEWYRYLIILRHYSDKLKGKSQGH